MKPKTKKSLPQARFQSKSDVYQGSDKTDLYETCNEQGLPERDFKSMFCQRCRNHSCENAGWSWSTWEERISTQEDRFLKNPKFADIEDPRFDGVREQDFPVLLQEALRLNSGVDWDVPKRIMLSPSQEIPTPRSETPESPKEEPKRDMRLRGVEIKVPIPMNTAVPPTGIVIGSAVVSDPWEVPKEKKVKVGATIQFGVQKSPQLVPPPK